MRGRPDRRRAVVAVVGAAALLLAGCGLDPKAGEPAPNPILGGGVDDELDAMALLDPQVYVKIGNCLDSAMLKVLAGDPVWQTIWEEGGRTPAGLRDECEDLAINEPATLDAIHAEWVAWEQATGAASG